MSLHMTIGSKVEKLSSPGTLMMKNKDKSLSVEDKVEGLDSEKKQVDFGSKEETFFDSQGWLDSDSEDDFVSVNGDSTPNYQINNNRTPQVNKVFSAAMFPDTTTSQISSADPKRKLAQLLQENQVEVAGKQNAACGMNESDGKPELYETDASLHLRIPHETSSVADDGTPSKDSKQQKEKKMKAKKSCLPRLCSIRFKERRKQKTSPVH
ncbi:uncharacterized protein At3g27210-like isoform X1 [Musa acuminata AAA Group]|uniref:(wild Malaysian banana) hypothetical protein n=1 Tax=Musa acuminata subsp. malaccensis TaxID=214687 RepID=A0A804JJ12_MUSAM|nr:PREDICTED: uncharacterized protein At3g27210-like isoform X1 [Musa acuminata subsp. malaccensis]CAG1847020.1 unnamed protein product [Musa acuminata subsp. malaccensis]